jgi:hypothetical protein
MLTRATPTALAHAIAPATASRGPRVRPRRPAARRAAALGLLLALVVAPAWAATIRGTVFEDRNYGGGAGRDLASAGGQPAGIAGVRVELYNGNTFVTATTTDADGRYSFNYSGNTPRTVRVVNGTLRSERAGGAACTTCVAVQTFRTTGSGNSALPVTNRVGGENPALVDAASNTSSATLASLTTATQTAQSIATFDPLTNASIVDGADFGFSFSAITSTRDAASCAPGGSGSTSYPCQGTLRQFIVNANALGDEGGLVQAGSGLIDGATTTLPSGADNSIFMVPAAQLAAGVAQITLAAALPSLSSSATRLDATTQTVNIGNTNAGTLGSGGTVGVVPETLPLLQRPEVQLNAAASGTPVTISGTGSAIHGFAVRQGYLLLAGANSIARNNLVGMTATGSSSDTASAFYGITFSAPGVTIRNNFVTVNNSAIRSDGGGNGGVISHNEVARPTSGHTLTYDGILLINGAIGTQILHNLVRDQRGGGIELGFGAPSNLYSNVLVSNNTVRNNGFTSGTTPSSEPIGLVAYNFTGSNVVMSRNVVTGNAGPGLIVLNANGVIASQNSFSGNGGLAIDLDPNTRDPNGLGAGQGVTPNDAGDADSGPNGLLNFPVITSAVLTGGELSIAGFARPGSAIELYIAAPDPTGFGEGLGYTVTLTEGSGADLDAGTGSYGPGPINGLAQGSDTTARFAFRLPVPSGITLGTALTATATLAGQTSEFSGNVIVTGGPALVHAKTVAVLSDPFNGTTNPRSIPGSLQRYAIRVSNQGSGAVDADSITVIDAIPANTKLFVLDVGAPGSGPVEFVDGSPSSALGFSFTSLASSSDSPDFSNDGGASWGYVPTPDADGCDAAVTHLRVRPTGTMAANTGSGEPAFELRLRVRVN